MCTVRANLKSDQTLHCLLPRTMPLARSAIWRLVVSLSANSLVRILKSVMSTALYRSVVCKICSYWCRVYVWFHSRIRIGSQSLVVTSWSLWKNCMFLPLETDFKLDIAGRLIFYSGDEVARSICSGTWSVCFVPIAILRRFNTFRPFTHQLVHHWNQETAFDLDEAARLIFHSGDEVARFVCGGQGSVPQHITKRPQPIQALRPPTSPHTKSAPGLGSPCR